MANLAGFDASQQGDMRNFDALPAHKALVMIVNSEMKANSAGTGSYLLLEMNIMGDGQYKGRKLWNRLNLSNTNKQAEDIANRELGAICRAVGILRPNDSVDLHNKPFYVDLGVKKHRDWTVEDPKMENTFKSYSPSGSGGAPAAPAPAPTATAAQAPHTPPMSPPWARTAPAAGARAPQ